MEKEGTVRTKVDGKEDEDEEVRERTEEFDMDGQDALDVCEQCLDLLFYGELRQQGE
jgi:hypothetical protein